MGMTFLTCADVIARLFGYPIFGSVGETSLFELFPGHDNSISYHIFITQIRNVA